jgi:aspartyl-tRNA(Asn)/glutamyl-tRNA(Gln) amidotransferase subunit C
MISKEDIEGLAELARLKLKDGEAEALGKSISDILGYVGQVNSFNAEASKAQTPILRNIMRDDAPREANDPLAGKEESIKAQFPKREGDYNVVRKIIQKDE